MPVQGDAFIRSLVDRFPQLRPALVEHTEDNFGEVLPHVFLAEVMRYLVAQWLRGGSSDVSAIVEYVEAAFATGDSDLEALISTGFLEALPRCGEPGYELRRQLGPKLSAEAARVA